MLIKLNRPQIIILSVSVVVGLVILTVLFFFVSRSDTRRDVAAVDKQAESDEQPDSDNSLTGEEEAENNNDQNGNEEDASEAKLAEVRAMFDSTPKIKEETEFLIAGLDPVIEKADQLIARAGQVSDKDCRLIQIYFEMDGLMSDVANSEIGSKLDAFVLAIESDILSWEFDWQPRENETVDDFDYTAIDQSILGENFDSRASKVGQELKTIIIQLRQRQKKMYYQSLQLAAVNEQRALLDTECKPIIH